MHNHINSPVSINITGFNSLFKNHSTHLTNKIAKRVGKYKILCTEAFHTKAGLFVHSTSADSYDHGLLNHLDLKLFFTCYRLPHLVRRFMSMPM